MASLLFFSQGHHTILYVTKAKEILGARASNCTMLALVSVAVLPGTTLGQYKILLVSSYLELGHARAT